MGAIESLAGHPLATAIGWGIFHSIWQVSAIALACAAALRLARRAGPDVRYAIAFVGLALMLAWPAATVVERIGSRGADEAGTQTSAKAQGSPTGPAVSSASLASRRLGTGAEAAGGPSANRPLRLERLVPYASLLWAAGVLLFAARTAGGWYLAQRLRHRDVTPAPEAWQGRFARLARRLKVGGRVALLESAIVDVPTVVGWLKPVVLVPASAFAGLAPSQLEAILAHELAHVRRHDYLMNLLQTAVETLLFYHPAVWWLSRQARAEREHCCDDLAVSLCGDRVEYARALADLEVVRRASPALVLGADGGSLLRRISRLLGATGDHEQRAPVWVAASVIAAMVGGFALMEDGVRAARTSEAADPNTTVIEQAIAAPPAPDGSPGQARPATPAIPSVPAAPAAPAAPAGLAVKGEGRISHSSRTEKWEARYKGEIDLSEDGRDIARVSPGGYFKVSEGGWFSRRSVEVTATANGIDRKFYQGLRELPYDPEAREFLAGMLQKLVRSGFAASQRVSQLLKSGGPEAVLQELEQLESDYARRLYYTELFEQATLDGSAVARALTNAGRQISSDYESAELLIAAAPQALGSPDARRAFFQAAGGIESDYEQRRAVTAALKAAELDGAGLHELLDAAASIDSDYEAAELLIDAARERPLDAATRQAFFKATNGIDSDYEHRRVLSAVMKQHHQDVEVRRLLLHSAAAIGSDYERAEFMLDWLKGGGFDASAREFLEGVGTISSGYERGRVLRAVLDRPGLSAGALVGTLRVISTTSGDYEISQLLQRVADKYPVTGEIRDAYLAAADRLSDSQKDEAYAALVRAERRGRN
jgi:beta-lactamase regulating signal transducer with metallopeptidase domain